MENETVTATADSMPTAARILRVEAVITDEPAFKGKIGKKTVKVEKRNGSSVNFAQETVDVAKAIHADGKDAVALGKSEILKYAMAVLGGGQPADAGTPAPAGPPVDVETTEADKPAKADVKSSKKDHSLGIVSLLCSALQLAEFDDHTGASKRKTALEELTKEYGKFIG